MYGPQGCGKTQHAARLCAALGMPFLVDSWHDGQPLCPGALHLTNDTFMASKPGQLVLSFGTAMQLVEAMEQAS